MDRKDFIKLLGITAATTALGSCISGCKKESHADEAPINVDFTLDLSLSENAVLNTNGGYLYSNGLIVARTLTGNYIAVSKTCTHETYPVVYQGSSHRFYCQNHGAIFSESGVVISGPTNRALKQYNTNLTGTSLRIFS